MGKPKYEPLGYTSYKISRRLKMLSEPKHTALNSDENIPLYTSTGVRKSALRGQVSDRLNEIAWPQLRRLLVLKRMYKNRFTPERLERLENIIEASNATSYAKLANCTVDLKKEKDKKRRGWTESEWKKHMEYISHIALPKKDYTEPPLKRGERKPLEELLPRIRNLATVPDYKLWQESGYRNPAKVSPGALKYVITDRINRLASPKFAAQLV